MEEGWFRYITLWGLGGITLSGLLSQRVLSKKGLLTLPGILITWGILHIVAYLYMGIPVAYSWHMALIAWIICLGAGMGLDKICRSFPKPWGYLAISLLLIVFLTIGIKIAYQDRDADASCRGRAGFYQAAGLWLKNHTPENAKVAASEVGILGYYSQRQIVDRVGLVTAGVAQSRKIKDDSWDLRYYRPDYYVRFDPIDPDADFIILESWWNKAYSPLVKIRISDSNDTLVIFSKTNDSAIPRKLDSILGIIYASEADKTDLPEYYIKLGVSLDARCRDGSTPLIRAADRGNLDS